MPAMQDLSSSGCAARRGRPFARRGFLALGVLAMAAMFLTAAPSMAQTTDSPFGGFKHDASQPIEVAADSLEVRNAEQVAVFRGNVDVRQGVMRMRADRIEISYGGSGEDASNVPSGIPGAGGSIDRLQAIGDVIISNGKEQAEAGFADYDVVTGEITLTGDVMLVQGGNVIKGDRLTIDLASGTGRIGGGRVRTIITPTQQNN